MTVGGVGLFCLSIVVTVYLSVMAPRWREQAAREERERERLAAQRALDAQRHQPLSGVATYSTRLGFIICTRRRLSSCEVRFARDLGLGGPTERVVRVPAIDPLRNCETARAEAEARCGPFFSAVEQSDDGGVESWGVCSRGLGYVLWQGSEGVDPRDARLQAGQLHVACDEGHGEYTFSDR